MAISGDKLRVSGIGAFLAAHFLKVPPNQRSFAWEADNVEDFWQDVTLAMSQDAQDDYFIGSIVLSETEGDGALEVVDGQQRLATTTIILGAIRDYFASKGIPKRSESIHTRYLISEDEDTLSNE